MLNNALILDESTEIVVVTNSNFQNNNEKLLGCSPQLGSGVEIAAHPGRAPSCGQLHVAR